MMTDSISQTRRTRAEDSDREMAVTRSLTQQGLAHRLKAKTRQTDSRSFTSTRTTERHTLSTLS